MEKTELPIVGQNKKSSNFFSVTVLEKNKPVHYIVRGDTIIDVAAFAKKEFNAPMLSIGLTEYHNYFDSSTDIVEKFVKGETK